MTKAKIKPKAVKLYACGTTPWEFVESNSSELDFYNTPEACLIDRECTDGCGVVEFEVLEGKMVFSKRDEKYVSFKALISREKIYYALADKICDLLKSAKADVAESALHVALARYRHKTWKRRAAKLRRAGRIK